MLDRLNAATAADAERDLLACCASRQWARDVAAGRPYPALDALLSAGDVAFSRLGWDAVAGAVAAHPRIGERVTGSGREAAWSRGDQAAAAGPGDDVEAGLATGNAEYERRFGRMFLICATGLDAATILAHLRQRLGNDEETERGVVREELRKIARLRLSKLARS